MTTLIDQQRLFTEKARAVSAQVQIVANMRTAFDYAVELCERRRKEKASAAQDSTSPLAVSPTGNARDGRTTIAAPALAKEDFALLKNLCDGRKIQVIREDLRNSLCGIDVGCTYADFGIAETGTLVINSTGEDLRLATMISDIHLAILPLSRIRKDATDLAPDLRTAMADPANFTAFITGPSRTADIERVLAIGVHGPLELHILLLEDRQC
jgi:L-lactate dehydrogenase complex protein LldG